MSLYLHFEPTEAKVKSFGAVSKPKCSTVRIELEVTDAWVLGRILSALEEARQENASPAAEKRLSATGDAKPRQPEIAATARLALPSPERFK